MYNFTVMHRNMPVAMVMVSGSSIGTQKNIMIKNIGINKTDSDMKAGQPFCASLECQAKELGFGFRVNYRELLGRLKCEEESRALEVLRIQLRKYESILRDDTLEIG